MRNHKGEVLLHSRHAISQIANLDDAKLQGLLWAIKCMSTLKIPKVIFGTEANELVGAVTRPKAWPSFAFQASEIKSALYNILSWKFHSESSHNNKGASLIAESASFGGYVHSYMATGFPFWLRSTLDKDLVPS